MMYYPSSNRLRLFKSITIITRLSSLALIFHYSDVWLLCVFVCLIVVPYITALEGVHKNARFRVSGLRPKCVLILLFSKIPASC